MQMSFSHDSHPGRLPTRVLRYNITKQINDFNCNANPREGEWYLTGNVSEAIIYDDICEKIVFPSVDIETREIHFTETYLAFVWTLTYSLLVLHEEGVEKPAMNGTYTGALSFDNKIKCNALHLFNWAMRLVHHEEYPYWPKDLPNPEDENLLSELEREYAGKVNGLFLNAVCFDYYHECGHLILKHSDEYSSFSSLGSSASQEQIDKLIEMELAADKFAFECCINDITGVNPSQKMAMHTGILLSQLAILFFQKEIGSIKKKNEPDVDARISRALELLSGSEHYDWACRFVAFAIKLFLQAHKVPDSTRQFEDGSMALNFYMGLFKKIKEL